MYEILFSPHVNNYTYGDYRAKHWSYICNIFI